MNIGVYAYTTKIRFIDEEVLFYSGDISIVK